MTENANATDAAAAAEVDEDEIITGGEEIVGRSEAEAAAASGDEAKPKAPAAAAGAAEEEDDDDNEPIILDKKEHNRIAAAVRRQEKARIDDLEKRLERAEAREHSLHLDTLATGGVKRSLLEKTGLTGDALEEFAKELAASMGDRPAASLRLEDAVGSSATGGISQATRPAPGTLEAAMENIATSLKHPKAGS